MPYRYALLVLLGAGAGLRQGEAFGLAFDRIDQDESMITVDQQVIIVDRHPVLASPKTSASLRDVPMPRFVRGQCSIMPTSKHPRIKVSFWRGGEPGCGNCAQLALLLTRRGRRLEPRNRWDKSG